MGIGFLGIVFFVLVVKGIDIVTKHTEEKETGLKLLSPPNYRFL